MKKARGGMKLMTSAIGKNKMNFGSFFGTKLIQPLQGPDKGSLHGKMTKNKNGLNAKPGQNFFGNNLKTWFSMLNTDLIGAIILLIALVGASLRSMSRKIKDLSRRVAVLEKGNKRGGSPCFIPLLAFISIALATRTLLYSYGPDRTLGLTNAKTGAVVGIANFKLPSDACSRGITVEKHCPKVANLGDVETIDCASTAYHFRLTYNRCTELIRGKRESPKEENKKTTTLAFLEECEFIAFKFVSLHHSLPHLCFDFPQMANLGDHHFEHPFMESRTCQRNRTIVYAKA